MSASDEYEEQIDLTFHDIAEMCDIFPKRLIPLVQKDMLNVYETYAKQITEQDRLDDKEKEIQSIMNKIACTMEFLEGYEHHTDTSRSIVEKELDILQKKLDQLLLNN